MGLRGDFIEACQAGEQALSAYHQHRLNSVLNDPDLLDFQDTTGFLLHVIPQNTFTTNKPYRIDIRGVDQTPVVAPVNPYSRSPGGSSSNTVTGIMDQVTKWVNDQSLVCRYAHLSTIGIVEAAATELTRSRRRGEGEQMSATAFEATIVSAIREYTSFLTEEGLSGPFQIHLSMFGTEDVEFLYESDMMGAYRFNSDIIEPHPVFVETVESDADMRHELSPLLASIWRAVGQVRPPTITHEGDWSLDGEY